MTNISFIANAIVIGVLCVELVAAALGKASSNQLLVSSMLSGVLTLISFKLSKKALNHLESVPDDVVHRQEQTSDKA